MPNNLHKEWAIKAAQAGKHVLCEKPIGWNAAEAEEMVAALKQAGASCARRSNGGIIPRRTPSKN